MSIPLPRLLIPSLLCLLLALAARAEVAPQRLLLLRGATALADHHTADAIADLRQAASAVPEDWRAQALLGEAFARDDQRDWARAQLRRAVLLAPGSEEAWQITARVARSLSDRVLEMTALITLLRFTPDNPLLEQRMAELYLSAGQKIEAEKMQTAWKESLPPLKLDYTYPNYQRNATRQEILQLLEADAGNPALLNALATEEWKAGHGDATRDALRKSYLQTPKSIDVIANYVHLCLLTGEYNEALKTLRDAAPLGDYALDRACARWSIALGHPADAIEPIQRLLMRNPVDPLLNRLLGIAQLSSGAVETSISALRIAWLEGHDAITAQHYLAALQAIGRKRDAEDLLKRALHQSPQDDLLPLLQATYYRDANRLLEAAEITDQQATGQRTDRVELLWVTGERFARAGYTQQAFRIAGTLRDQYPADPIALQASIQLYRQLSATAEARLALTRYLGPGTAFPFPSLEIMLQLARLAAEDNRLDEATQALEEVIKGRPTCREAYLQLGRLYLQQGAWVTARRLYDTATARWPADPVFMLAKARASAQEGNLALAVTCYQKAAAMLPDPEPYLELGVVFHRLAEEAQARECWMKAQTRPGGALRAQLSLLGSYERAGETMLYSETLDRLLKLLATERESHLAHWRQTLAAMNLSATADELNSLLLLDNELTDPAPLQARLAALQTADKALPVAGNAK